MKRIISIVLTLTLIVSLATGCGGRNVDKEAGFKVDDYIKLGQYTDFDYNIDQAKYDELLEEKTYSSEGVNRAAKMGDEIEFSYTGYIKGKKVKDLSQKDISTDTKQEDQNLYKKFADALIGKKKGDTASVTASGKEASTVSKSKKKYTDNVTFKLKVIEVNEVEYAKVTDEWVKDESGEDAETAEEFYDIIDKELVDNAKADLWKKAVDDATMSSWPPALYDKVKEEEEADAAYEADQWNMSLKEYYEMQGETKETLEEEYMFQVKSTLVMWAIVSKENIKVTNKEVADRYKSLFEELQDGETYKTIADVRKDYSRAEIKEALYLEKAQNFVYDNSNVKITYKGHKQEKQTPVYDDSDVKETKKVNSK